MLISINLTVFFWYKILNFGILFIVFYFMQVVISSGYTKDWIEIPLKHVGG
jgi:hypothetical protein